jgi:hypothetical protein
MEEGDVSGVQDTFDAKDPIDAARFQGKPSIFEAMEEGDICVLQDCFDAMDPINFAHVQDYLAADSSCVSSSYM